MRSYTDVRILPFFLSFAVFVVPLVSRNAFADEAPQGKVTLARATPDALIIWDATPAVVEITNVSKTPAEQALRSLESRAMTIAAGMAPQLTSANQISVRVVYLKLGAVNPMYRAAELAGVERVFSIGASRGDVLKHGQEWATLLASGKVPDGVSLTMTGELPPLNPQMGSQPSPSPSPT
jgi:hypothetical protein